jgi:hypothetical protein
MSKTIVEVLMRTDRNGSIAARRLKVADRHARFEDFNL